MTKTELQSALAEATQTDKKTAGVFLDTLSALAYKDIKKNVEFVLPGFGKLVKQRRKVRMGFNPKTQQKIKIPAKTVVKFRVAKAAKDAVLGVKSSQGVLPRRAGAFGPAQTNCRLPSPLSVQGGSGQV
jgi:DNA-binding protein HU-beta